MQSIEGQVRVFIANYCGRPFTRALTEWRLCYRGLAARGVPSGARVLAGVCVRIVLALALLFALQLHQAAAEAPVPPKPRVLADFEGDMEGWVPRLQQVKDPVKNGSAAGCWSNMLRNYVVRYHDVPVDWSAYGRLEMWCHSKAATGARFLLIVSSDNPGTPGPDYFFAPVTVEWAGWRQVRIPYRAFRRCREPAGWKRIDWISFCATGYEDCKPVPGTVLTFDDIALVKDGSEGTCILGDFEEDAGAWQGAVRDTQVKRAGEASGRLEPARTPFIRSTGVPKDWSSYRYLDLWLHSAKANGQQLKILAKSDRPETKSTDCYVAELAVDWQGWKHLVLRLNGDFQPVYRPVGWKKIDCITIAGGGWGITPKPDTVLHLDDVRLHSNGQAVAGLVRPEGMLGDFEVGAPEWQGLVRDTAIKQAGEASGRWASVDRIPLVRCTAIPHDWSEWSGLAMWIHSAKANGQSLKVLLYSDNAATPGTDSFMATLRVNWQGWRRVVLSRPRDFQIVRRPVGWHDISNITIVGDGWGLTALPDTLLHFDDIRLVK